MRKSRFLWQSIAFFMAIVLAATGTTYVAAEENAPSVLTVDSPTITINGGWINKETKIEKSPAGKVQLKATNLPASYNSKSYVTKVENQGDHNICWAFVQNTLAAINVKKDEGISVNYSETHMAYSTSLANGNTKGFDRGIDDFGNYNISIAYMTRGSGLVADSDDPYITSTFPNRTPSAIDGYFSTGYVEAAPILVDCTIGQIKELIYEYGAVGASIHFDERYYGASNYTYCYTGYADPNHGITLVGWDNSRNAFLALNSWGTAWGSGGYFWLSFNDRWVCHNVLATDYKSGDLPYDGIRNYSDFGHVTHLIGNSGESVYYSTTYDTGNALTLEGIGTYAVAANTKFEIYVNPYDGDGKTASKFKKVHTQTFANPGYYHISFNAPVYLYGSKFNVKIKITSVSGGSAYLPLQMNYSNYLTNSKFQTGRSYFGQKDGKMWLLEEAYAKNTLTSEGWVWAMQAFTNSDMEWSVDQAKVALSGETYKITLSKASNGKYSLIRNGASVPLYTNAACSTRYTGSTLPAGTYYTKLQNGTHIRRKVSVSVSNAAANWSLSGISGASWSGNGYSVNLTANTFKPTVQCSAYEWNLYALPGGIGKIGKTYTPSAYHSVVYLRITATDKIASYDYPIHLFGPAYKKTTGFSDWNKVSNWAKDGVTMAVKHGLLQGSDGKLKPSASMTRAEAAVILLRGAGIDFSKVGKADSVLFGDLKKDGWYLNAIGTAAMLGMVGGHNDPGYRAFSPNATITREQFAIMTLRALAYDLGVDYQSLIVQNLSKAQTWMKRHGNFADLSSVSSWAKDAVTVALYLDVIGGSLEKGKLYIYPNKNITREQAAVIICNSFNSIY